MLLACDSSIAVHVKHPFSTWPKGWKTWPKEVWLMARKRNGVICNKFWRQFNVVLAPILLSFGAKTHGWPQVENFWPQAESVWPQEDLVLATGQIAPW